MQRQLPANRLRELREAKGLKDYDIASMIKKHPATIWRWENGRGTIPDEVKMELAEFYGVTISYLMGWPESAAA